MKPPEMNPEQFAEYMANGRLSTQDAADCANEFIQKLFDGAVEVYGSASGRLWDDHPPELDQHGEKEIAQYFANRPKTHKAILLKPEPIRRGVSKEEIVARFRKEQNTFSRNSESWLDYERFIAKIELEGIV